jgi:hypothetical protein
MAIYLDMLMEDHGLWESWTNASLEETVMEMKRKLGLEGSAEYDTFCSSSRTAHLKPCTEAMSGLMGCDRPSFIGDSSGCELPAAPYCH